MVHRFKPWIVTVQNVPYVDKGMTYITTYKIKKKQCNIERIDKIIIIKNKVGKKQIACRALKSKLNNVEMKNR